MKSWFEVGYGIEAPVDASLPHHSARVVEPVSLRSAQGAIAGGLFTPGYRLGLR